MTTKNGWMKGKCVLCKSSVNVKSIPAKELGLNSDEEVLVCEKHNPREQRKLKRKLNWWRERERKIFGR